MFSKEAELRAAIDGGVKFKGRELRLKKATDPKKREKKANRKEAALEVRKIKRDAAKKRDAEGSDDSEDEKLQGRLDNYESEDSEDEKPKKMANMPKVVDLSSSNSVGDAFAKLGTSSAEKEDKELKMQNVISFN